LAYLTTNLHDLPGEYQPVYDEFGSILLLILGFKYRYDLDPLELGIESHTSFLAQLFERHAASQTLEDLTETQSQHLGAWITAIFIAESISDELMSSYSPQEFYLLVPTLFSQSLGACDAGKLDIDTLKGSFECMSEDPKPQKPEVLTDSRLTGAVPPAIPGDCTYMAEQEHLGGRHQSLDIPPGPSCTHQARLHFRRGPSYAP
jgi:hypothetical protein